MGDRVKSEVVRIVVVDDESRARKVIRTLLARDDEVAVVGECCCERTPAMIEELQPDLVFLDVQMPRMDGFGVLRALAPVSLPLVVFTTAYDEYAVRAFEHRAVDYLLKPFSDRRFYESLARAKEVLRREETDVAQRRLLVLLADRLDRTTPEAVGAATTRPHTGGAGRVVLHDGTRTLVLTASDIVWIEAEGPYVRVHTEEGETLVRESLRGLEERLDPREFFRIHRSAMINLGRVQEIRPLSRGDSAIILRGGIELRLSRTRRRAFEERLGHGRS